MPSVTIKVTLKDKAKIKRLIANGNFSTQSEVVRAGLRKLRAPK